MALPTDRKAKLGLSFIFRFPVVVPWVCHMDVSYPEKLVVIRCLFGRGRDQRLIGKRSLHQG